MTTSSPEIALIGGGTGSFTILQELKEFTPNITAIVNMSDDGGSTGVLRDELGVLPPGDVRQCLVALSDLPEARELFNYRFDKGMMAGHSLGNVILSGLELQYEGDFRKAIDVASSILHTRGKVVPVTLEHHVLVLEDGDERIVGEANIGERHIQSDSPRVRHEPNVGMNSDAVEAILSADLVVIAPGNIYGSILPALAVNGMRQAIQGSNARKISISNLVTKPGQTDGWHVVDYVKTVEQYIGEGQVDTVLYNAELPSDELLSKYAEDREFPLRTDPERFSEVTANAIGANLLSKQVYNPVHGDTLRRTLIRHDARQVGRQLMRLFYE